ncbi:MAG: hypothetical protein AAFY26_10865 [Cyanobacteria bacterium J06638_22]
MNTLLERYIQEADGRYLTDSELGTLDAYLSTYSTRMQAYKILQEKSESFILEALQQLAQTDAQTIRQHKDKCVRDMVCVMRAIAVAVLRDDEQAFRDELLLWLQNILSALHKEQQSSRAYRLLQDVVSKEMPSESAELVNYYLGEFIAALTAGLA